MDALSIYGCSLCNLLLVGCNYITVDSDPQDDATLVARVLAGDKAAFGVLIDRHRPGTTRLAQRMLNDSADAEEVGQEAFLQAFLGLRHLRTQDHFGAWLMGIIVNLCRMRLRARHGVNHDRRITNENIEIEAEPSPETLYEARELHQTVLAAIATLSPEQQQTVRLHYLDGLALWEVGAIVGMPIGTVKSHLHRARHQLRLELTRELAAKQEPDLQPKARHHHD